MESISKYELRGIAFLVRHFSTPHTIRQIALKLGISPPGLHKGFKKLEEAGLIKAQRFGSGVLYQVDLDNAAARHLAGLALLLGSKTIPEADQLSQAGRMAIRKGDRILLVTDTHHEVSAEKYKITTLSSEAFALRLRQRDKETTAFIEDGDVLFGEDTLLHTIKNSTYPLGQ
ncbi:MAG: winged helix-turn-helix domain-containing protein [archaeon]